MQEPSDDELVRQLQKGYRPAFDTLMERHHMRLSKFVHHYIQDADTAKDIVQETFIRVFFKVSSFRFQSSVRTWIYQIALNLCKDHGRKAINQTLSLDEDDSALLHMLPSTDPGFEVTVDDRRRLEQLKVEIAKLPHKLRVALIAFAIEECSQEECARLLGITPKAVEVRVYRARKILADKLYGARRARG